MSGRRPSCPQCHGQYGRCLDANLAQLAVIASQAFHVTERAAPPRLAPLLEEVRALCPPLTEPRALARDVERLAGHFTQRVFDPAAEDLAPDP